VTHFPPIAALASGSGSSAVAIIRLTGHECHTILAPLLGMSSQDLSRWPARQLKLSKVLDPVSQETLDEPLVVLFRGARSFTGEDSAEIHAHGGPYIVQRLLSALYRVGFRPAEPGEFTRRAFLHGKLDLTAAEGIRELVEAQSHQQWAAARQLATGRLKDTIESIRTKLIETLAYLEAQIDFPDEGDTAHLVLHDVERRARSVYLDIQGLLNTYRSGRVASQGLMVALFGSPNAGKSTLLNELLGKDRAIVTDVAGTTRDYIEERCLIDGRLVRLFDMAGVRDNPDPVEAIGIEAAKRLASEADLVVFLVPADQDQSHLNQVTKWVQTLAPRDHLHLVTKSDLGLPPWAQELHPISCKTGEGISALRKKLAEKVDSSLGQVTQEASFITSTRHAAALESALKTLDAFFEGLERHDFVECLAYELHDAVKSLSGIVGTIDSEDVLDKIFSQFCIGK
jgi:tRNA modification GTPase